MCVEVGIDWSVLTRLGLKKKKKIPKDLLKIKVERDNVEVIKLSVSADRSVARGQETSALLAMRASGDFTEASRTLTATPGHS